MRRIHARKILQKNSVSLLIIPPNDAESILIAQLARAIGLPIHLSSQKHGATLDAEKDILKIIHQSGCGEVMIVEMPGVKTEKKISSSGFRLTIIDHHHYTGLDRAHDAQGNMLPSSLEQFLRAFHLTDARLKKFGFDPFLVRGIGILDRGFIWALKKEGYTKRSIENVLAFHDALIAPLQDPIQEKQKELWTKEAWQKRTSWNGFLIVQTARAFSLRPRLSRLVALEMGKPTSLVIIEKKRRLVYVQESDFALMLFQAFGGFTFGLDRNWGYQNEEGKPLVWLREIKRVLAK